MALKGQSAPYYKETGTARLAVEQLEREKKSEILFVGGKIVKFLDRNPHSENDSS